MRGVPVVRVSYEFDQYTEREMKDAVKRQFARNLDVDVRTPSRNSLPSPSLSSRNFFFVCNSSASASASPSPSPSASHFRQIPCPGK